MRASRPRVLPLPGPGHQTLKVGSRLLPGGMGRKGREIVGNHADEVVKRPNQVLADELDDEERLENLLD